ncbi:unnamed protein product, partial [Brenthis ino]
MGKPQSKEEVTIAQNGAANQASTSMLHEKTHDKLDILLAVVSVAIFIVLCYLTWKFCNNRFTKFLRQEMSALRASRRSRDPQHTVPAYSVA